MCINFLWKISLHTAFAAASVTVLTIQYGSIGALTAMLIPPIAWARIELEQHSLTQAVAGALLAGLIVVIVFHFFGLIGSTVPL
jgi:membrane-associated phospholipid phosphatase